jgi:hypothetical protein
MSASVSSLQQRQCPGIRTADVGALFSGAPEPAIQMQLVGMKGALQGMFVIYGLAAAWICTSVPNDSGNAVHAQAPLRKSRKIVSTLAALFSLDSPAGGFVLQSLLALWSF